LQSLADVKASVSLRIAAAHVAGGAAVGWGEAMEALEIALIGVPMEAGAGRRGCAMGPEALRAAGLEEALAALGHSVRDRGNLSPGAAPEVEVPGRARAAGAVAAWVRAIDRAAQKAQALPVFMGGDHALSIGSVNGMARRAEAAGRPLHVLWLDAHTDFNTPATSPSGNVHGMPVAAMTGEAGCDWLFEGIERVSVPCPNIHQIGIRSVDPDERRLVGERGVDVIDMRRIDETGISRLLAGVLEAVTREGAMLHVSLDVDFLAPEIAPGVGTAVPGGATYREAHLLMEMLSDSGLVTSLDLVELNPFLDERGRSAILLTELTASLFGRRIIDRRR
jgi:arginase